MIVLYNPEMSTPSYGCSPSGSKPAAAVADWEARGLDIEIVDFEQVTEADLYLAHDPKFAKRVLTRKHTNGHGNYRTEVTASCLWTVGSMVAASRQALVDGITCSPSSGFHHAGYDYNGCFCTFNGLIIAARKMIAEDRVAKVGIIDCDAHYGDGTDDIIVTLELESFVNHWTFGGAFRRNDFKQEELYLELGIALKEMREDGVELILYQAGADPHINDPLGGLMTSQEMMDRDKFIFDTSIEYGIPVAWNFAGGYQQTPDGKIDAVLELHRATAEVAIRAMKTPASSTSAVIRPRVCDVTLPGGNCG